MNILHMFQRQRRELFWYKILCMMGYNVRSSSLDYVTYITKFVQACLCYQQTLDGNVVLQVVIMSAWHLA